MIEKKKEEEWDNNYKYKITSPISKAEMKFGKDYLGFTSD